MTMRMTTISVKLASNFFYLYAVCHVCLKSFLDFAHYLCIQRKNKRMSMNQQEIMLKTPEYTQLPQLVKYLFRQGKVNTRSAQVLSSLLCCSPADLC